MVNAAAKVASTGNENILLCERGTSFGYNMLVSDMRALPIMAETGYPVIFDATHSVHPKTPKDQDAPAPKAPRVTKQQIMIDMLSRPEGATIEELAEATQWLGHTVRGAMSGALKKKLGLTITSEKEGQRGRVYRLS